MTIFSVPAATTGAAFTKGAGAAATNEAERSVRREMDDFMLKVLIWF
jgi:hypothetical protein